MRETPALQSDVVRGCEGGGKAAHGVVWSRGGGGGGGRGRTQPGSGHHVSVVPPGLVGSLQVTFSYGAVEREEDAATVVPTQFLTAPFCSGSSAYGLTGQKVSKEKKSFNFSSEKCGEQNCA